MTERFVADIAVNADENLLILSDFKFWNDNYDELMAWCNENGAQACGMTVVCNDVALTAFVLRWS